MEILYEGIKGSPPQLWAAWLLGIVGVFCLGIVIYAIIERELLSALCAGFLMVICGVISYVNTQDTRYPIVKATINDTISWKEVNEKYRLLNQEGDIYTFEVRENVNE